MGKVIKMLITLLAPDAFDRVVAVVERQAQRYIDWFDRRQGVVKAIARSDIAFAAWLADTLDDAVFHKVVRILRDVALADAEPTVEEFLASLPTEVQDYLRNTPRPAVGRFIKDVRTFEGGVKRSAALAEMEVIGLEFGENVARLVLELAVKFVKLGKPKV